MMITGRPGAQALDALQQVEPGAARHADVAHQHLRAAVAVGIVGFAVGQRIEHGARTGKAARGQVLALQGFFEDEADRLVVVNDPDGVHASAPWSVGTARPAGHAGFRAGE